MNYNDISTIKFTCGHCKGNNIELSKQDDIIQDQTMLQVRCNDCTFCMKMPIPNYAFDSPDFDIAHELQDAWNKASANAKPPTTK